MTVLFDPRRHEPVHGDLWHPGSARDAIQRIVADALAAQRDGLWPRHPLDPDAPDPARSLYYGAAGTLCALSHLTRVGLVAEDSRVAGWCRELPASFDATPEAGAPGASFFVGRSGVLLVALRDGRDPSVRDLLSETVSQHSNHASREAFLGAAGTMLAAVLAHEATGDDRWRALYLSSANDLVEAWQPHPADQYDLWTQELYGAQRRLLGASHGFAGNVLALLRGWRWLDEATQKVVVARATAALTATAVEEDGLVNWPVAAGGRIFLLQWCHGAPGVITSLATAPKSRELDALLARAGELVWRAGPLRKGPGLCHGTAGNGEAFLALFARSGDEVWLHRARRFAMHALAQVEAARVRHGRGRYGLWTGDLGVALYVWQCLEARSGLPSLDF